MFKQKDRVKVKNGASDWMQERDYWLDDMPKNIDGFTGYITDDYTNLSGDMSHYIIDFGQGLSVGINPKFLESVN
jgi:hypothetical protein